MYRGGMKMHFCSYKGFSMEQSLPSGISRRNLIKMVVDWSPPLGLTEGIRYRTFINMEHYCNY